MTPRFSAARSIAKAQSPVHRSISGSSVKVRASASAAISSTICKRRSSSLTFIRFPHDACLLLATSWGNGRPGVRPAARLPVNCASGELPVRGAGNAVNIGGRRVCGRTSEQLNCTFGVLTESECTHRAMILSGARRHGEVKRVTYARDFWRPIQIDNCPATHTAPLPATTPSSCFGQSDALNSARATIARAVTIDSVHRVCAAVAVPAAKRLQSLRKSNIKELPASIDVSTGDISCL